MAQYKVTLPFDPRINFVGSYDLWVLNPQEVLHASEALTSVQVRGGRVARHGTYHPTAIARKKAALPLRNYVNIHFWTRNVTCLYHGVGRDLAGAKFLESRGRQVCLYDPHHPDPAVRVPPSGVYDEIFSIYTLNVIPAPEARRVLKEILGCMKEDSVAVIAVRRDL